MTLSDAQRAEKSSIVAFAGAGIRRGTIERFDDDVYVTANFGYMDDAELSSLCLERFSTTSNAYHPCFFVVLDKRTEKDGSVLLYHQNEDGTDRVSIRVSPATIPSLVVLLDTGMNDIPSIKANHYPKGEEDAKDWVYDACLDCSDIQINIRLPSWEFKRQSPGPDDDMEILKKRGIRFSAAYEAANIELKWFGEAPDSLLLQAFISEKQNRIFVTGAIE
ncbi:uncharacterized protein BT62DRAFT_937307 [Guyanagaster necrorhizus]|uniref:Uncharacterized protein n=1 Tax=Guyanagaster necrorhizus TaxID=856835 RepID=A0A9P7VHR2_9AGAR|nr:uncharacterized protein BT62DRAFT_937307 [Guyanagaster necrorhizus MCA 3950]KAG7441271.1 hypothetical protein BT62DRAFT_937307 [Guyanagaster necrorhizus MCA 3950]